MKMISNGAGEIVKSDDTNDDMVDDVEDIETAIHLEEMDDGDWC